MSWNMLPEEVKQAAQVTLTEKQLTVFKLELAGLSVRSIGRHLNIARQGAADHLYAAHKNLRAAGVHQDEYGRWTLQRDEVA